MQCDAGAGGVAVDLAEGVFEDALDGVGGGVVGVERELAAVAEAEGAEVVHAEDVVGVAVGVEDGVEAADVFADGLGVEVGTGVDEDVCGRCRRCRIEGRVRRLRRAGAVRVGADGAVAAERGDAHGGAAAEKGEGCLHGV